MNEKGKVFLYIFMFFRHNLAPAQRAVGDCSPLKKFILKITRRLVPT